MKDQAPMNAANVLKKLAGPDRFQLVAFSCILPTLFWAQQTRHQPLLMVHY